MLNMMRRLHRGERGITGLETAIILIAFVVVAAVFAYTVLSAGIFSTQKSQETIYSGLEEASGSMQVKGGVIARNRVVGEPVGTGDGTTTTFYTWYAPVSADSQTVYVAGTAVTEGTEYTFTDATGAIVFVALSIPAAGQAVTVDYEADASKVATLSFVVSNSAAGGSVDLTVPTRKSTPDGTPDSTTAVHKAVVSYWDEDQRVANVTWYKSQLGYGDGDDLLEPGEQMELTVNLRALTTKLDKDVEFTLELKPTEGGVLVVERTTPHKIDPVMDLH